MKDEIDKIFSDFYSYNTNKEHISMPVGRAKKAIQALLNKQLEYQAINILNDLHNQGAISGVVYKASVDSYYKHLELNQLKCIKGGDNDN